MLAVDLLFFLLAKDEVPYAFLYECAGPRCYAVTQPRGGATPYVQMVRLLNSENYHVELVKNCNAYGLGNPTWRPRAFVFAYAANPSEDLIVPEGVTILEEESESEEEYE